VTFHSRAAATGKARSPMVGRRVRVTTSYDVDAELTSLDGVLQQGTAELTGVGICKTEQPA